MKETYFTRGLEAAQQRAERLRQTLQDLPPDARTDLSPLAIEELQAALDELSVADEELRAQNDQLLATQQELEEQRTQYQELFEFAPDPYLVTDQYGRVEEANEAACRILKIDKQFLIGKPLPSFVAEGIRSWFRTELNRITKEGSSCELEAQFVPRDGAPFQAALTVAVARNHRGEPRKLRWLLRDITIRRLHEEQIRLMNETLEQRVAERTAALESANKYKDELLLREKRALDEAEAANKTKDDFIAIVSHELRTPLNAILGWTKIVLAHPGDPDLLQRALETIQRNANAQAKIINDLLDVSRIIAGRLRLQIAPVSLVKVVEAAVEAIRPAAADRQLTIETDLDRQLGRVSGDPDRLYQVVANLLSNALKFTPAGGKISVKLDGFDSYARLTVSDTGIGMHAEFLPHIFDRFRQEDVSGKRVAGLGLGLSIVRNLVQMHGGKTYAHSEGEGLGSTFTVMLPIANAVADHPQTERKRGNTIGQTPQLDGVRVLIVDDEQDAREMLEVMLEQNGAAVTAVGTCGEAVEILRRSHGPSRPDILLADLAMPGENGFDLIRYVRELDQQRGGRLPAVAVTALVDSSASSRSFEAGYDLHVAKPVEFDTLLSAVRQLLSTGETAHRASNG
jgi:PAS domain S-box-containing protein